VLWAAKRYFPLAGSILDLGCGTGLILKGIERLYPNASVYGGDLFPEALVLASKRLERTSLFLTDISALPFEREFDLIGIFDVLEHIEEDEAVLREINRALVPGGGLMVTVPQHPYLWSRQDEHSLHIRRYRAEELNAKMLNCGFRIISETSFVSMLLPFLALSRFLKGRMRQLPFSKCEKNDPMAELKIPRWLNRLLDKVMSVELSIIEGGGRFHAGGSLFVAAVKKEETGPGRQGVDTKYEIREGSVKSPRSN
jgi:SAM-dependent methyltransferase